MNLPKEVSAVSSKIPVLLKSPKRKKQTCQGATNLVCSTPLTAIRTHFEDNVQISPIYNASSSPTKSSRDKSKKIMDEPDKSNKSIPSKNEFPIVHKVKIFNMVLCDSDYEIFPKKHKGKHKPKTTVSDTKLVTKNVKLSHNDVATNINKQILERKVANELIIVDKLTTTNNIPVHKSKENNNLELKKSNFSLLSTESRKRKTTVQNKNETTKIIINDNKDSETGDKIAEMETDINNETSNIVINLIRNESENTGNKRNDNLIAKKSTQINILPVNSRKTAKDDENKRILFHGTKITDDNKSTILNNILDNPNLKVSEPKKKRRKQKTEENIQHIRRSTRKRKQPIQFWLPSVSLNEEEEETEKETDKIYTKSLEQIQTKTELSQKIISNLPETDKKPTKKPSGKKRKNLLEEDKRTKKSTKKLKENVILEKSQIDEISDKIKTDKSDQVKPKKSYKKSVPKNKILKFPKMNESKGLAARKIRKSLTLESKYSSPKKTSRKSIKQIQFSYDENYTTEEENDVPRDTLLLKNGKITEIELPRSEMKQKRKKESSVENNEPKKVKLQTQDDYSFKEKAILADVTVAKTGGLADVYLDGRRCLLGCFGKFPRHYSQNSKCSDVSVGISINNGNITTGILEIEADGKKKYEYAKRVDLLFFVIEGTAEVGIGNSSQVLRMGQDFYVPKHTPYYIINLSSTNKLLIYFSKTNV